MMLQVMAYAVAVTAMLTVVGHCLERLAALRRFPRRTAWIAVMLLSVLFPMAMILGSRTEIAPNTFVQAHWSAASAPASASAPAPVRAATPAVTTPDPIWKVAAPTDNQLIAMWATASLMFSLYLLGANLMLRRRAANWQRTNVLGQQVLVSEVTGPALLGMRSPQIVVPRWLLEQPAATQELILEHERQHIKARDPLLAVAGLFVIAAIPWNVPLWWQWRRMRQAVEMDCDARVLDTGAAADTYGEVLLAVTQRATRMLPGTLAMSEPTASLERRIDCLEQGAVKHAALQSLAVIGLAVVGAGVALALDAPALPVHVSRSAVAAKLIAKPPATPAPAVIPAVIEESPVSPVPASKHGISSRSANVESSMNKSRSLAVTVAAVSAVVTAQAPAADQSVTPTAEDIARTKAEQIIAANDLNKDGIVTHEEAEKVNGNLYFMWTVVFDTDHDGKVDVAEVTRALNDVALGTALEKITGDAGGHLRGAKPELVIQSNDQNGDGIVTKEEAAIAGKALIRMWNSYDLNKDGKVDVAEVAKAEGY